MKKITLAVIAIIAIFPMVSFASLTPQQIALMIKIDQLTAILNQLKFQLGIQNGTILNPIFVSGGASPVVSSEADNSDNEIIIPPVEPPHGAGKEQSQAYGQGEDN